MAAQDTMVDIADHTGDHTGDRTDDHTDERALGAGAPRGRQAVKDPVDA